MNKILILAALLAVAAPCASTASDIIPRPLSESVTADGRFHLSPKSTVAFSSDLKSQSDYLVSVIASSTGWDLKSTEGRKGTIVLSIDTIAAPEAEGYQLTVTPKGVTIKGHDAAGVFYGIQTLLQLFPAKIYSPTRRTGVDWSAECVTINDAPDYPWRGMMLDAARYYYEPEYVKRFIDMMAMYKLNKLQFHFIDDSGWRLESKKYPRLTEVGAWAGEGDERIGGFYTQEQIRDIIDYAAVRGVEIIPEIEFPAHILSAVVAYPWLSCTGEQHKVPRQHFISRDLICPGKESSLKFLRDILDETADLFPSRYINIGGDEAVYTRWEQCPDCQALMKRLGMTKASELQGWLTNQVAEWMKERGRTVIGWEEIILRGDVSTPVVGLIWHNPSDSIVAKPGGHKAILTPASHLYFDFPESSLPGEPQHATWMPPISVKKAYNMPLKDHSPDGTVIGVQGCMWSDQFIHNNGALQDIAPINENRSMQYVEHFTMPRMLALAELGWTPQAGRDYADFNARLAGHFP
ncbi:MAG: beta-N-acetylhexosaminidase, partial [Muribaculaceae bacterium]|nr:beta-N-acetylhexosaminidase [Muribaculaceae bacterium]